MSSALTALLLTAVAVGWAVILKQRKASEFARIILMIVWALLCVLGMLFVLVTHSNKQAQALEMLPSTKAQTLLYQVSSKHARISRNSDNRRYL